MKSNIIKILQFVGFCYKLGKEKNYNFKSLYAIIKDTYGLEIIKKIKEKNINLNDLSKKYVHMGKDEVDYLTKCIISFTNELRKNADTSRRNKKIIITEIRK